MLIQFNRLAYVLDWFGMLIFLFSYLDLSCKWKYTAVCRTYISELTTQGSGLKIERGAVA